MFPSVSRPICLRGKLCHNAYAHNTEVTRGKQQHDDENTTQRVHKHPRRAQSAHYHHHYDDGGGERESRGRVSSHSQGFEGGGAGGGITSALLLYRQCWTLFRIYSRSGAPRSRISAPRARAREFCDMLLLLWFLYDV